MNIHIENYRNLDHLDCQVQEGRVNFIFGVCGAGKSSILSAISEEPRPTDTTVGHDSSETIVSVDGEAPTFQGVRLYDTHRKDALFQEQSSGEYYDIFIGREDDIERLEAEFDKQLESLRSNRDKLYVFKGKIQDLKKAIGPAGVKNTFTKGSKYGKALTAATSASPYASQVLKSNGIKFVDWRNQGFQISEHYESGQCPFCEQKIDETLKIKLEQVRSLSVKDIKPIIASTSLLEDLKIREPDYSDEVDVQRVKDQIVHLYLVENEVCKVIDFCNIPRQPNLIAGELPRLEIDPLLYDTFPELEEPISEVKEKSSQILRTMGEMRGAFSKLIGENATNINRQLKAFGIPYRFVVDASGVDLDQKKSSYILKHKDDSAGKDMRAGLSFGEMNLVALLLFLSRDDGETILIDDPASSYDDFRRRQIFRCIMRFSGKTVIVVSHDQAFIRYAAHEKQHNEKIGTIKMMSHSATGFSFFDIAWNSFGTLDYFVKARIASSDDYYQKLLNYRLYSDMHREEVPFAWRYSSAIMHKTDRASVNRMLAEQGTSEKSLLKQIRDRQGISLPPMPEEVGYQVSPSYSEFEKLIAYREELATRDDRGKESNYEKEMLDDLVHMNEATLFCLNPYEYGVWSPALEELLVSNIDHSVEEELTEDSPH